LALGFGVVPVGSLHSLNLHRYFGGRAGAAGGGDVGGCTVHSVGSWIVKMYFLFLVGGIGGLVVCGCGCADGRSVADVRVVGVSSMAVTVEGVGEVGVSSVARSVLGVGVAGVSSVSMSVAGVGDVGVSAVFLGACTALFRWIQTEWNSLMVARWISWSSLVSRDSRVKASFLMAPAAASRVTCVGSHVQCRTVTGSSNSMNQHGSVMGSVSGMMDVISRRSCHRNFSDHLHLSRR